MVINVKLNNLQQFSPIRKSLRSQQLLQHLGRNNQSDPLIDNSCISGWSLSHAQVSLKVEKILLRKYCCRSGLSIYDAAHNLKPHKLKNLTNLKARIQANEV